MAWMRLLDSRPCSVVSKWCQKAPDSLPGAFHFLTFCRIFSRVTDGARTRDLRDHNPMLCQLSYGHQAMVQFYQPALGVQKLLPTRCRSEAPLPSINRDQLDSATQCVISAPHHCAIGRLLHTGTRGPKSCRSAHRILLPASKDSNRRHSYSGPTLVPVPRRKIFSLSLLTFAGGSIRPFGTCRTPV